MFLLHSCEQDSVEPTNRAPEILSLISQHDSIKTLSSTNVTCTAIDPDGDSLTYMWSTGGAAITDSGSSIIVESPQSSGILPISCTVFDSNGGKDRETIYISVYGHYHHTQYSSEDKSEAREIALWLGRNLTYSDLDYYEVMWSLNEIRYFYGAEYSFLKNIRFQLPWISGQIIIKADSATTIAIKNEQYTGWETVDDSLRPSVVEHLGAGDFFLIDTGKPYNPWILSDLYAQLPGIILAEPNLLGPPVFPGTYPIIPVYLDERTGYIFNSSHYFEVQGEIMKFVGQLPYTGHPKPKWVLDAEYFIQNFAYWGK